MSRWSNTKNYKLLGKFKKISQCYSLLFYSQKRTHTQHKDTSVCAVKKTAAVI